MSVQDAVRVQLDALLDNNEPWLVLVKLGDQTHGRGGQTHGVKHRYPLLYTTNRPNHGIQTMYEFGEDIGGLDPSLYFGFKKDLYHFDHYMVRDCVYHHV